jgi:hypothetical protein
MQDEDKKPAVEASQGESTEATEASVEPASLGQRLKEFKETYIVAASAIDKLKEPLQELIMLKQTIDLMLQEGLMDTEEDWRKFVYNDLGQGMAKRMHKERSYQEIVSGFFLDTSRTLAIELQSAAIHAYLL